MTNPTLIITKLLTAAVMLGLLGEAEVGVGAYYQPSLMREVCNRRVERGWTPDLHCDWPCLVAGIEQDTLGDWVLVDVPGASFHYCQVVDVGAAEDLPALRARGEVIEVSWGLAQKAGWDGYQEGCSGMEVGMNRLGKGIIITPFCGIAWELRAYGRRYWGIAQEEDAWRIELGHCIYYIRKATSVEIDRGTFLDIFTKE